MPEDRCSFSRIERRSLKLTVVVSRSQTLYPKSVGKGQTTIAPGQSSNFALKN